MTPSEIKTAAGNLNDLERIPQIIKDLEAGVPISVTIGTSTLNIGALQASDVRKALEVYLEGLAGKARAQLADLGVADSDFDATLNELDADAQPKGSPN